jgi:cytochrome c oxidase subunit 4
MSNVSNIPTHWRVFIALAALTLIEVWVAGLPMGDVASAVALIGLAVSKALLVALYYMHLAHERKLLWYVALFPFLLSAIMIVVAGSDSTLNP